MFEYWKYADNAFHMYKVLDLHVSYTSGIFIQLTWFISTLALCNAKVAPQVVNGCLLLRDSHQTIAYLS